jgi:hypothetical protein
MVSRRMAAWCPLAAPYFSKKPDWKGESCLRNDTATSVQEVKAAMAKCAPLEAVRVRCLGNSNSN